MPNLRRKQYLQRHAPDNRPRWDDPDLTIAEIPKRDLVELQKHWQSTMKHFDHLPKRIRDKRNEEGDDF